MEIVLLTVGKTQTGFVKDGIENYVARLRHYVAYSIIEVPDVKQAGRLPEQKQKEEEGKAILSRLATSDLVILLDERGKEYSSMEFATRMESWMAGGRKRIVFVVGGPYGFSQAIYERADGKVSLSRMTFNHEMVRLFFTEQIYRAMTILRGEPYHHE